MATVAVIGGGNGGFAAAADLQTDGHRVQLYNRSYETIAAIDDRGGIEFSGAIGEGFVSIPVITCDLATVVEGADVIVVVLPATAFESLAADLSGLVTDTPILLNPGSTGGALLFHEMFRSRKKDPIPRISETNTLTYICRKRGEDHVHVSSKVENVRCGTISGSGSETTELDIEQLYPDITPVSSVLHTSLCNVNAVLHPPGAVLSAAWIEATGGDFRFYYDGATPAVANVMSRVDDERLAIGDELGLDLQPFPELFAEIGSTSSEAGESGSFLRILRESEPNKSIRAPESVDHRFYHEDIPYGLVPMSEMADRVGVGTPLIDSLITAASSITGTEFRSSGWSDRDLGLTRESFDIELTQL